MADVVVLGDGPAGTAAATAIAEAGVRVLLVAPRADAPWVNRYGGWVDELEPLGLGHCLQETWRDALVYFDGDEPTALGRAYARIDNVRLRATLLERLRHAGGEVVIGEADRVVHDERGSVVSFTSREELRTKLVIDATGHRSRFVAREPGAGLAAQVAYGVTAEVTGGLGPRDAMVLMDLRATHLTDAERAQPSFLYVMPLADGRTFLEETSLVSRPPMELAVLEARLQRRARALGLQVGRVEEVERCFIPMGVPRPRLDQRTVAWGGAASMVHPATGYLVREALERAPALGATIAAALRDHPREPSEVAGAAWGAVWPRDRRRAWDLYAYGMEVLLELDSTAVQRFFRAFFSMDRSAWQGYLSGRLPPTELMATMARVFARAPWGLRARLMSKSFSPAARELLRGIFG